MSCTHLRSGLRPAPFWRRVLCRDCRRGRGADSVMAFAINCRREQTVPSSVLAGTLSALDLPHSIPHSCGSGGRSVRKRAARLAAALASCLALAGLGWTRSIEIEPIYTITEPSISGPNAYTEFRIAAVNLGDKETAARMLLSREMRSRVYGTGEPDQPSRPVGITASRSSAAAREYTLEEKEGFLRRNRPALEAIRMGLGKPYLAPPIRSISTPAIHYADARALTRLLRLDSETAATGKRWGDAARSALDAVALGSRIQQNGGILARLTGAACESMGREALWPLVDKLTEEEAMAAAARLQRILDFRPPFYLALEEERNVVISRLKEVMSRPGWRRTALSVVRDGSDQPRASWATYIRLLPYSKKGILKNTQDHMDWLYSQVHWAEWKPSQRFGPFEPSPFLQDPITSMVVPISDGAWFQDLASLTQSTLMVHALQLRAYYAKSHRYPATYNDYVQDRLLQDPFSNTNLVYRGFGDRYLLYSVGPDGVDNNGSPVSSGAGRHPQIDSRGDIVARVNAW